MHGNLTERMAAPIILTSPPTVRIVTSTFGPNAPATGAVASVPLQSSEAILALRA